MRASLLASAMARTLWCSRFLAVSEPMTLPALWLDQYSPRGLNEQNTQVAIAAFRYLAKDGAIAG